MMNTMTDVAAFVLPSVVAVAAAAAVIGGALVRRQVPAVAVAATRPHATDLGLGWAGSAFGTSGVMTKRTAAAPSYDPQSRGSTG
jgi:hypothetical protein